MTESQLENAIAANMGITKAEANKFVNTFKDVVKAELKDKGEIKMSGIGRLYAKLTPARTYRNPKTGEPIAKPDTWHVKFKESKTLEESINEL